MQISQARSDIQREMKLITLSENFENDPSLASFLVTPLTLQRLGLLLPDFSGSRAACDKAMAERALLVALREEKRIDLDLVVRHTWTGLENRTVRLKHSPKPLLLYGAVKGCKRPPLRTSKELLITAEALIEGERLALAAGYAPLANPGMDEVQSALAGFREVVVGKESVDLELARAQSDLHKKRKKVDQLLKNIAILANMAMEDKPEPYKRRVLRNLGFRFVPKKAARTGAKVDSALGQANQKWSNLEQPPLPNVVQVESIRLADDMLADTILDLSERFLTHVHLELDPLIIRERSDQTSPENGWLTCSEMPLPHRFLTGDPRQNSQGPWRIQTTAQDRNFTTYRL